MIEHLRRLVWRTYLGAARRTMRQNTPDHMLASTRLNSLIRHHATRPGLPDSMREALLEATEGSTQELLDRWDSLPIVQKNVLRSAADDPRHRQDARRAGARLSHTGGATGEPTPFFVGPLDVARRRLAVYEARRTFGWEPGQPIVGLWGSERDVGRSVKLLPRVGHAAQGLRLIEGYRLDPSLATTVSEVVRNSRTPVAIYGFTGILNYVAQHLLEADMTFASGDISAMWNGGESVLPTEKMRIESAFGTKMNNLYGAREVGAVAFEWNSELKVTRDLLVEVVGHDDRPVEAGDQGRILITNLANPFSPIIRYEIGDTATAGKRTMGPFVASLHDVRGRKSGTIPLGNGREVSALSFDHLFKDYPVLEFTVTFDDDTVHAFVRTDQDDVKQVRREVQPLIEQLVAPLRASLSVSTLPVPRSNSGKLEHVWPRSERGA